MLALIVVSLVIGAVVSYSILYLYPYQRSFGGMISTGQAPGNISTQITTIPLGAQREIWGTGSQPTGAPLATNEGYARVLGAELLEIREEGGRIYLIIGLSIGSDLSEAGNISLVRVTLSPLAFPYAWNGSSWVYGDDEKRCLSRIALPVRIVSYSYTISSGEGRLVIMSLKLDLDRSNVFGKYNLSIIMKLGTNYYNITRELGLGGYADPAHPSAAKIPTCP